MRIAINTQAAPISSEKPLVERLRKLSRRPDGTVLRRILVENADHQPRISIETFTASEDSGIRRLLEDAGFRDRAAGGAGAGAAAASSARRRVASSAPDVFDSVYRHLEN